MMHRLRDEAWVTVEGLERYEVSSYGRVYDKQEDKDVELIIDAEGQLRAPLIRKGRTHWAFVCRLVAMCFFAEYQPYIGIYFKNNNPEDCTVLNLTLSREKVVDESRTVPPPGASSGGDA